MFDWKWRLGARVLVWAVLIGLLWTVALVGLCYGLLGIDRIFQPDNFLDWNVETGTAEDAFWVVGLIVNIVLIFWFAPRGLLVGALCGFYAPASSLNPLRSPFLWRVIRSTVLVEGAGFLVSAISAGLCAVVSPLVGIGGFLLLELIVFGLALWHALNCALREERALLSDVVMPRFGGLERGI